MLPCSGNVNAQPRKVSCKLVIDSNTITDVKLLTFATDWTGNITIGQVVSAYISVTIPTPTDFTLAGKNVVHSMGIGDPVEWVQIGNFRVDEESIRTKLGYTSFRAYDKLRYANNIYSHTMYPPLSYPVTLKQICDHVCTQIGITSTNLPVNPSFTADSGILETIDGYTMRDVLGFIAGYCGKNAFLSPSGALDLRWFSSTSYTADGTRANIPYIGESDCSVQRLICQTQDSVITTSNNGQGIYFTCPFMTQDRLNAMLSGLSFTYRKAEVDIPYGNFCLQSGDIITVSTTGSNLSIPIMSNSWTYDGGLSSSVTSYGVSDYQGNANNAELSISAARVQRKMAAYRAHTELETATQIITGAVGGYIKINFGNDGKTAELLVMDQPDINQALNVWVFNQNGLGHMERESTSDPFGTMNVALTRTGTVAAERIAGTLIKGVGFENTDDTLTYNPQIHIEDGVIGFNQSYGSNPPTVTPIGKISYKGQVSAYTVDTLALEVEQGNNITIGMTDSSKFVFNSAPTGGAAMFHFYDTVRIYGDLEYGTPSGNTSLESTIADIYSRLGGEGNVPDVTSSDDGKVLTASYSGGVGSYSWENAGGGGGGTVTSIGASGYGISTDKSNNAAITDSGTLSLALKSTTKSSRACATRTSTSGREYQVELDSSGYLAVNVPWQSYSNATTSTAGLMSADDKKTLNSIVKTGVCNLSNFNNGTKDAPVKIPINGKSGETYIVSWSSITSTSSASTSRMAFMSEANTASNVEYATHGAAGTATFTLTTDCDSLWVYAGTIWESNKTVTVSNFRIRPNYLPDTGYSNYTMTNEELTAAIQAIQAQLN